MPFDSAILAPSAQELLDAAVSASGLSPISKETLEQHKAAQLRRHRAGWAYRHSGLVQLGEAVLLAVGILSFFGLSSIEQQHWGLTAALASLVLAMVPTVLPVKGPARWEERVDRDLRTVHPALREGALRLGRQLPGTRFRIGELFQDRVRLDPYLIAEYQDEQVVLGIWDGETLIAGASAESCVLGTISGSDRDGKHRHTRA